MTAIMYRDDWKRYPDAIIDTKTSNKSFIRYASLLKEMGIKNHAFPLALLDPSLQGVDPHDPNLPLEVVAKIAIECKANFFFSLGRSCVFQDKQGLPPFR